MLCHAGRNITLPKALYVTGWITCLWSIIWCFWAPNHLSHKDYVYEPTDAAQYAAWAPLVWSLAISWIIFIVFTKNDGNINELRVKFSKLYFSYFRHPDQVPNCKAVNFSKPDFVSDFPDSVSCTVLQSSHGPERGFVWIMVLCKPIGSNLHQFSSDHIYISD